MRLILFIMLLPLLILAALLFLPASVVALAVIGGLLVGGFAVVLAVGVALIKIAAPLILVTIGIVLLVRSLRPIA